MTENTIDKIKKLSDVELAISADLILHYGGGNPDTLELQDREGILTGVEYFVNKIEKNGATIHVFTSEFHAPLGYEYPILICDDQVTLVNQEGVYMIVNVPKKKKAKVNFQVSDEVVINDLSESYHGRLGVVTATEDGGVFVTFEDNGEEVEEWFPNIKVDALPKKKKEAFKMTKFSIDDKVIVTEEGHLYEGDQGVVTNPQASEGMVEVTFEVGGEVLISQSYLKKVKAPKAPKAARFNNGDVVIITKEDHPYEGDQGVVTNPQAHGGLVEVTFEVGGEVLISQGYLEKVKAPKAPKPAKFSVGDEVSVNFADGSHHEDIGVVINPQTPSGLVEVAFQDGDIESISPSSLKKVKAPKAPKQKYLSGNEVLIKDELSEYHGLVGSVEGFDADQGSYLIAFQDEQSAWFTPNHFRKNRVDTGKNRIRKLSDEAIRAIRARRIETKESCRKVAEWAEVEFGVKVTGDLIRSITIGEIYTDVE